VGPDTLLKSPPGGGLPLSCLTTAVLRVAWPTDVPSKKSHPPYRHKAALKPSTRPRRSARARRRAEPLNCWDSQHSSKCYPGQPNPNLLNSKRDNLVIVLIRLVLNLVIELPRPAGLHEHAMLLSEIARRRRDYGAFAHDDLPAVPDSLADIVFADEIRSLIGRRRRLRAAA
jgi:hypothetical protein